MKSIITLTEISTNNYEKYPLRNSENSDGILWIDFGNFNLLLTMPEIFFCHIGDNYKLLQSMEKIVCTKEVYKLYLPNAITCKLLGTKQPNIILS